MKALLLIALAAGASAGEPALTFRVTAPAGWTSERSGSALVLYAPKGRAAVLARIVVRHVPEGDPLTPNPAAYMTRLTRPFVVPLKGWRNGRVESVVAAGRPAKRLERDTTDSGFIHDRDVAPVAMKEEHVAVPASKGFYVLAYYAPAAEDASLRPLFRKLLAGFKPEN